MKIRSGLRAGMGLGDAVANVAQVTGADKIAQAYEAITGKSCGCKERQEALNRLVPNLFVSNT